MFKSASCWAILCDHWLIVMQAVSATSCQGNRRNTSSKQRQHELDLVTVVHLIGPDAEKSLVACHAGSERNKLSGATGEHFREACSINKSLTCLGRVIMELVEAQRQGRRHTHIPYRDSRLTFLLQVSPPQAATSTDFDTSFNSRKFNEILWWYHREYQFPALSGSPPPSHSTVSLKPCGQDLSTVILNVGCVLR